jgi:uncharacterized protein involved in exopolysaccharide biosynthesis
MSSDSGDGINTTATDLQVQSADSQARQSETREIRDDHQAIPAKDLDSFWPETSPPAVPLREELPARAASFPVRPVSGFLRRNTALILGVGVFTAFWMSLYAWTVYTPRYAAKSTVIIKDSAITSRYVEPQQNYALQTTTSNSSNPVLNTMALLKSKAVSDALWEYMQTRQQKELKRNRIKTQREWNAFFQDGSGFIKAKNQPGTDLIAIQFSWRQPLVAKEGLEAIVEAFQESSRDLNKQEEISRTRFLGRQVKELETQLKKIRRDKSAYRSRAGTVSMPREQDELAASRINLANRLSEIEAQARGKETQAGNYQRMLGLKPEQALEASAIGQNGSMAKLQDELYRLKQLYSLLNASLTENNPKVREVQAQIDQVSANIEAERGRTLIRGRHARMDSGIVADSTRGRLVESMLQAQGEARDLRAQAAVLRSRLAEITGEIRKYPSVAETLSDIEQQETSLSLALDQLRQKVIEGRIKEEQTLSNVFVVDAPRLPEHAQFPTPVHLTVIGVLLGLGTGVAVAFLRERVFPVASNGEPPSPWLETLDEKARHPRTVSETDGEVRVPGPAPGVTVPEAAHIPPAPPVREPSAERPPVPVEEPDETASGVPPESPSQTESEPEAAPPVTPERTPPFILVPAERGASTPPRPRLRQAIGEDSEPSVEEGEETRDDDFPTITTDRIDTPAADSQAEFQAGIVSNPEPGVEPELELADCGSRIRSRNHPKVRVLPTPSPETIRPLFQSVLPASRWSYEWPSSLPAMHATEAAGATPAADSREAGYQSAYTPEADAQAGSLPKIADGQAAFPVAPPSAIPATPSAEREVSYASRPPAPGLASIPAWASESASTRPAKRRMPTFLMRSPSIGKRSSVNHPLPNAADSLFRAMQALTAQPLTLQPQIR